MITHGQGRDKRLLVESIERPFIGSMGIGLGNGGDMVHTKGHSWLLEVKLMRARDWGRVFLGIRETCMNDASETLLGLR